MPLQQRLLEVHGGVDATSYRVVVQPAWRHRTTRPLLTKHPAAYLRVR